MLAAAVLCTVALTGCAVGTGVACLGGHGEAYCYVASGATPAAVVAVVWAAMAAHAAGSSLAASPRGGHPAVHM